MNLFVDKKLQVDRFNIEQQIKQDTQASQAAAFMYTPYVSTETGNLHVKIDMLVFAVFCVRQHCHRYKSVLKGVFKTINPLLYLDGD